MDMEGVTTDVVRIGTAGGLDCVSEDAEGFFDWPPLDFFLRFCPIVSQFFNSASLSEAEGEVDDSLSERGGSSSRADDARGAGAGAFVFRRSSSTNKELTNSLNCSSLSVEAMADALGALSLWSSGAGGESLDADMASSSDDEIASLVCGCLGILDGIGRPDSERMLPAVHKNINKYAYYRVGASSHSACENSRQKTSF